MSRRLLTRLGVVTGLVLIPLLYGLAGHDSHGTGHGLDLSGQNDLASKARLAGGVVQRVLGQSIRDGQALLRPSSSGSSSSNYGGDDEDVWIDMEEELPTTSYDGGLAGYTTWSNLYLSAGAFMVVESDLPGRTIPATRQIMSGPKRPEGGYGAADEERWRVVGEEVARGEVGKRAILLKGITYIFNDGPGGEGYLIYFRHFVMEAFLGATRALSSGKVPKRIWFPRCGTKPSWRDDRSENVWFISHAMPGATIEDATGFEDRNAAGLPYILEKAVIIDRWAAHSVGGETGKWGKMNADIPTLEARKDFWEPFRLNVMRSMGVDGPSRIASRGLPVVVYIDRQKENPKMDPTDHDALIEALKTLTNKAEVHVTKLSSMSRSQQIELMSRADIMLGVHGDEMMTALWMKHGSTMIELYEPGGFVREFELLASGLNHRYVAIHNDRVLDEDGWRKLGNVRGDDKDIVKVNADFVTSVVGKILDGIF